MISYEKYNVFIKISFFLEQFKIHDRIEGQYWDVLCTTCPHICIAYLIMNITHQSSMFVLVDEPTLTNHHTKFIVYIRVHSWYYTFYGFWQMFKYYDMYAVLYYHTE